jgi:hypothetical protein
MKTQVPQAASSGAGRHQRLGSKYRGKPMQRLMVTAIAALSVCAVASCASNPPPPPATAGLGPTEGIISFTGGAVAAGIGFRLGAEP